MTPRRTLFAAALLMGLCSATAAAEIYTGAGLPGFMLGYAHPLGRFTLRADFAALNIGSRQANEEGIDYQVEPTLNRLGLFGDWFFVRGFRLTGGLTFNRMRLDMHAFGNGQNITIGGTSYPTAADDRMDVKVEFPRTTPYLGVGYGHQISTGLGFVFDLGASIGKAKVSATASGSNLGQVSQSDIDAETQQLRDGVGKVQAFPQLSLGLAYRF